jgi:calcium/calmodulin-dependent protein kinase I
MRKVRQAKGELTLVFPPLFITLSYLTQLFAQLLIRVEHTVDRDRWVSCLNSAAKLSIHDLYDFDSNSFLGQGRYASVYKARRKGTDEGFPECAIKVVDKTEFWSRVVKNMERADTLVREAAVQATLTCKVMTLPTILKLSSLFETCDSIVMEVELLDGTDLFRYVSSKNVLGETEAASIVRDVLVCLEAMSRFGVAHRDIKPANILMCDKDTHGVHVKVADFGMSTFVGVDGQLRGRCGTPGFVAPEIFSAGVNGGYGNKVDVFSTGVTLYIMLCGYEPFYGESDAELIDANKEAHLEFPAADWDHGKFIPGSSTTMLPQIFHM